MGISFEELGVPEDEVMMESASGPYSDNCAKIGFALGHVVIGDTERPGQYLVFRGSEWDALVARIKAGHFDGPSSPEMPQA